MQLIIKIKTTRQIKLPLSDYVSQGSIIDFNLNPFYILKYSII